MRTSTNKSLPASIGSLLRRLYSDFQRGFNIHPGRGQVLVLMLFLGGCHDPQSSPQSTPSAQVGPDGAYHVFPGEDIQRAMDAAAHDPDHKTVIVHAGTYGPSKAGQAFLQFHHVHDGLVVQASGRVVLTAEAPHLAKAEMPSYPAVVNHVVYFGDGITNATVLRGFRITGANGYVDPLPNQHSFEPGLEPGLFFYWDGGAVKIFGRSYPTLEGCAIENNRTLLCGGGVSVEHRGRESAESGCHAGHSPGVSQIGERRNAERHRSQAKAEGSQAVTR